MIHCHIGCSLRKLPANGVAFGCRYAPDALDFLPEDKDMLLMNFYGRYSPINDLLATNVTQANTAVQNCCIRLNDATCQPAAPAVGLLDLGGAVLSAKRFALEERRFMQFDGHCQHSCHDGALTSALFEDGWSYATHPPNVCAFYHNSNFKSCEMVGGVYFDSNDYYAAGCYQMSALPIPASQINWLAFTEAESACICPKSLQP